MHTRARAWFLILGTSLPLSIPGVAERGSHRPGPLHGEEPPSNGFAWFEPNRGQSPGGVEVVGRGRGVTLLASGRRLALLGGSRDAVAMLLDGPPSGARWRLEGRQPGTSHYFLGKDPAGWVRGVPQHSRAVLPGAAPGVDFSLRGEGGRIAYGLRAEPGRPSRLRLAFEGASGVEVAGDGSLVVRSRTGAFRHSPPVAWQDLERGRRSVPARFRKDGDRGAAIEWEPADARRPVFVDPTIEFSSTFGGSGDDYSADSGLADGVNDGQHLVSCDASGNAYVMGATTSTNFPVTAGSFDESYNGNVDIFVTKIRLDPPTLLYATFVGSSNTDNAWCISVDGSGQVCCGGDTAASDFPTTAGAFQPTKAPFGDAVVFRLTADGSDLVFSTYLGGGQTDHPRAIAFDSTGAVVVAGATASGYAGSGLFPTRNAIQAGYAGSLDAFITKLEPDGTDLIFSTYYGGSLEDGPLGLCLDASDNVLVTGLTASTDFPTANPIQPSLGGAFDAFVLKLQADGSSASFATYLGGTANDAGTGIGVSSAGAVHVVGSTKSSNFPLMEPLQGTLKGTMDAFVSKLNSSGSALVYSTFLGGSDIDRGMDLRVAPDGRAVVTGETRSTDFPTVSPFNASKSAIVDGFVAKLSASGATLSWSSYFGGNANDHCRGIALSGDASVCLVGFTTSTDFHSVRPLTMANTGGKEMFITLVTGAPKPPSNLSATVVSSARVDLEWQDNSNDETGFDIEREKPPLGFFKIATTAPEAATYVDSSTVGDTTYNYRVRAASNEGSSSPSNVATVTTPPGPPGPPLAPSGLVATIQDSTHVLLEWADNSDSETFFQVNRRMGSEVFTTLSTPSAGAVSYADATVAPSRTYTYSVKAGNMSGLSLATEPVTVTLPATLECAIVKGRMRDVARPGYDRVLFEMDLSHLEGAIGSSFDPTTSGLHFRLGDFEAPPLLQVAGNDEGWLLRKGRWRWRSPKGAPTKAKIAIDPATGVVKVAISKLQFPAPLTADVRFTVGFGMDSVIVDAVGTLAKPVLWKFP